MEDVISYKPEINAPGIEKLVLMSKMANLNSGETVENTYFAKTSLGFKKVRMEASYLSDLAKFLEIYRQI